MMGVIGGVEGVQVGMRLQVAQDDGFAESYEFTFNGVFKRPIYDLALQSAGQMFCWPEDKSRTNFSASLFHRLR